MGNRVVSIVLALSLLAAVFVALPTSASVDYTGSVKTTDNAKTPKDVFVQGQYLYVVCEVLYLGVHSAVNIEVRLETLTGGLVSHFHVTASTPDPGWYNSTEVGAQLLTTGGAPIPWDQDRAAFYVILEDDASGFEIARAAIIILRPGLTLDPPAGIMGSYVPGQTLTAMLITSYTGDVLYVHTTNSTGYDVPGMNWSTIIAPEGYWERTFVLDPSMPDDTYSMNVRDSVTHALRHTLTFSVQKYILALTNERYYYLAGETAVIHYMVIDLATLSEYDDVTISYQANWINSSGVDSYQSGQLAGPSGNHSLAIPTDVASYSDVWLTYWANETTSMRSVQDWVTLYTGQITAWLYLSTNYVIPGSDIEIRVEAAISWEDLPGANVEISVESNGTPIADYGATGLLTDSNGEVYHAFTVNSAALSGTYIVTATISKAGQTVVCVDTFTVQVAGWIETELDRAYYLSGDTAVVHWKVMWNGEEVTGAQVTYLLMFDSIGPILGYDSSGVVSIGIPVDYVGTIQIELITNLDGYFLSGFDWADVFPAELRFVALNDSFRPGDVLEFYYEIITNLATAELRWEIFDGSGVRVASGAPIFSKTGVISFEVPFVLASFEYRVELTLLSQSKVIEFAVVTVPEGPEPPMIPAPYIVLDSPSEGLIVTTPAVEVRGSTEVGAVVVVNGEHVWPDDSGSFSTVLALVEGVNLITVTADDGMGNIRTLTRNVTYENPVSELQTQLAQVILGLSEVQADMISVLQQLADIGQNLIDAWTDLNESRLTIDAMWDDLNSSDVLLGQLQLQLEGLRTELTTTHSDLNSTQLQLEVIDSLQAQIDTARATLNETRTELQSAQSELDSLETELDETKGEVQDSPNSSTVMMWMAAAVVLSVVAALAVSVLMRRRSAGG